MRNTKTSFTHLTTVISLLKNLVVLVMAWSLAVAPEMALAQGKPQPQKPIANAASSVSVKAQQEEPGEPLAEARGGPHEGIKVHGHWVIEVHNPDGSLVSRTEFENSLVGGGTGVLSFILARQDSVGFWGIVLASNGGTQPCSASNSFTGTFPTPCNITEPNGPSAGSNSTNLAVSVVGEAGANALQLTGFVTAAQNASIGLVNTKIEKCGGTNQNPATCTAVGGTFTSRLLAQPVLVASGQIVQVTVTLSFS